MPQLEKRGKFVFGISVIGQDGAVIISPASLKEYHFYDGDKMILMSGSRTSGGFVVTEKRLIECSNLAPLFYGVPGLMDFILPEAQTVESKNRFFCWTTMKDNGRIRLPAKTLAVYRLHPGHQLVAVRGSNLGITCIARARIWELAMQHPEVERFA